VKQGVTIFNQLPECVKNAPSKLAAKRAIAKKTKNITEQVYKYRLTRGHPGDKNFFYIFKKDLYLISLKCLCNHDRVGHGQATLVAYP
jgi:hypothetical protein